MLQRIVDDIVDTEKKPILTNYIAIMCIFLKQQYDSHALTERDEVGTHGIDYGLFKPDNHSLGSVNSVRSSYEVITHLL